MTKGKIEYRVVPPEADAEFVARMEEVLDTDARAYDPAHSVRRLDEQPVQLWQETRTPIPATARRAQAWTTNANVGGQPRFSCLPSR